MNPAFEVVFQDEYIVILNKIAKILTVPTPKKEKNTLTAILEADLKQPVFPCHRLDRETTGLIIYALSRDIEGKVFDQFRVGKVTKRYVAFVSGHLRPDRGVFEGKIIDREGRRFGEAPKPAKAFYKVVRYCAGFCVVELNPVTGRTNQLRIQLAQSGHPILGEDKYAFRRDFSIKFKRLALHAFYVSFRHPVSGDFVELKIGLPDDMKNFLQTGDLT